VTSAGLGAPVSVWLDWQRSLRTGGKPAVLSLFPSFSGWGGRRRGNAL